MSLPQVYAGLEERQESGVCAEDHQYGDVSWLQGIRTGYVAMYTDITSVC